MKKSFFLLFFSYFLLVPFSSQSQEKNRYMCFFDGNVLYNFCNTVNYDYNQDAEAITNKIVEQVGLNKNFTIAECPDLNNALAMVIDDKRYIVYDKGFMGRIKQVSGSNWSAVAILAHEIGHHLNGHTLKYDDFGSYTDELQADEFAGFVLQKMGATLEEAKSGYYLLSVNGSSTHPPQLQRLEALASGWNRAKRLSQQSIQTSGSTDADYWFDKAFKTMDLSLQIEYYTKAITYDPKMRSAYYNRAVAKLKMKKPAEAVDDLTTVIGIYPSYADAYNLRGYIYGNYIYNKELALSDYNTSIEIQPNNIEFLEARMSLNESMKNYEQALSDCNKIINLDPNNPERYINRALWIYEPMEKWKEAHDDLKYSISLNPNHFVYYVNLGDFQLRNMFIGSIKAKEPYQKAMEVFKIYGYKYCNDSYKGYFNESWSLGQLYLKMGEYQTAYNEFTKSISGESDSQLQNHKLLRGIALFRLKRYQEAIDDFDSWFYKSANNSTLQKIYLETFSVLIANCYYGMDKHNKAMEYFNKTSSTYSLLTSIATFTTGITMVESLEMQLKSKGYSQYWLEKYDDAILSYSKLLELLPDYESVIYLRGVSKYFKGDYEGAIIDFNKVIEIDGNQLAPYRYRGFAYSKINKWGLAAQDFKKYCQNAPDDENALVSLGWYLILSKQYNDALTYINKGLSTNKNNRSLWVNLAHAYLLTNNFEKAKEIYLRFKKTTFEDGNTWESIVKGDFGDIEKAGITHPDISKIKQLLGIN